MEDHAIDYMLNFTIFSLIVLLIVARNYPARDHLNYGLSSLCSYGRLHVFSTKIQIILTIDGCLAIRAKKLLLSRAV